MDEKKYNEFDNVLGEEYDLLKLAYPHYDDFELAIGEVIVRHFSQSSPDTISVLEVGSGTGITTKVLLECDPRLHITAIDNEPKMMEQLDENLNRWNARSRVVLIQKEIADYLQTIPDNTFDVVASGFVIHNMSPEAKNHMISEAYRVLKPNGIFVNGDKYAATDPEVRAQIFKKQIARYDVYDTIERSDYKKEWLEHMHDDEKPDRIFIEGEAKEFMESIGFKNVTTNYRDTMEAVISGVK